jgi:phosphate transport system protein
MSNPAQPAAPDGSSRPAPPAPSAGGSSGAKSEHESRFEKELLEVKKRLVREAVSAVDMLERALAALWKLDKAAAGEIRQRDDTIDNEEIEIEQACLRLMALQHPFGRDFRVLAFILKANADVERVADHATSIAKICIRIQRDEPPAWPTTLTEMGARVPMMCHSLLRALLDENADAAREVVTSDELIDELDKRLFDETLDWMQSHPGEPEVGIYITRVGRELERVGDLMANIAEDVVYLATGAIIRHEKRRTTPRAS